MTTVEQILFSVRINQVYMTLTGLNAHQTGRGLYRGFASWRAGDNLSAVSMDAERGVWHDFVTGEGGGIIDLVIRVKGGSKQDALRWLADYAGVALDDKPMAPEERQKWAEERQETEQFLPTARRWRRMAVRLTDELLDRLKEALFDPDLPQAGIGEIHSVSHLLMRLDRIEGAELVKEYLWWAERYPGITAALVMEARRREQQEQAALKRFLREAATSNVSTAGH